MRNALTVAYSDCRGITRIFFTALPHTVFLYTLNGFVFVTSDHRTLLFVSGSSVIWLTGIVGCAAGKVLGESLLVVRKIENVPVGANNRPKLPVVVTQCGELWESDGAGSNDWISMIREEAPTNPGYGNDVKRLNEQL